MERQETLAKKITEHLDPEDLLGIIDYRTDTIQQLDHNIKAFCPIHGELVFRTLIVNTETNTFRCSYSLCPGNQGGDLVDLYALAKKISRGQAVEALLTHVPDALEGGAAPTTGGAPAPPPATDHDTEAPTDRPQTVPPTEDDNALLDEAKTLAQEEQWADAAKRLATFLERHPGHLRALIAWTQCLEKLEKRDEAVNLYPQVIEAALREQELATAQAFFRKHTEAADDVSTILSTLETLIEPCRDASQGLNPLLEALIGRAERFEAQERFEQALALYRAAEPVAPPELDLQSYITQLLIQLGQTDQALAVHQERFERARAHSDLPGALGCLREMMAIDPTRTDLHQTFIEHAIEDGLSPSLFQEVLGIIDTWITESEYALARDALDLLAHYLPHERALQQRLFQIAKDQDDLGATRDRALKLAELCRQEGRPDEAITYLEALPHDPATPGPIKTLAQCQFDAGRVEDAAQTLLTLIKHCEAAGAWGSAEPLCAQIAQWQPEEPMWQARQATCLRHIGKTDEALALHETAGLELLAAGRFPEAADVWADALALDPGHSDIAQMRHNLLRRLDRPDEARQLLSSTVNYLKLNRDAEAAATFLAGCLPPEERSLESSLQLADLWSQAEQPSKASEVLQTAIVQAKRTGDVGAQVRLAQRWLSYSEGNTEALEIIAEHGPTASHATDKRRMLLQLGESYESKREFARAIETYTQALGEDPADTRIKERLIRCHEETGDHDSANRIRFHLAEHHYSQRQWQQALDALTPLMADNPEQVIVHLALQCHIQLGHGEQADKLAHNLIEALATEGDFDAAINLAEQMVTLAENRTPWQQRLLDLQEKAGRSEQAVGTAREILSRALEAHDRDAALATVDRLIELAPEDRAVKELLIKALDGLEEPERAHQQRMALVGLHRAAGDEEAAATQLRGMLRSNPENTEARRILVEIHVARGESDVAVQMHWDRSHELVESDKVDEAIRELEKLLELDPEHHDSRRRLADLFRSQMQMDMAVEHLALLAQMLADGGEAEQAIAVWEEVVEIRPEVIPYHTALITCELAAGGGQRVQEHVESLMNSLLARDELDEALTCLAKFESFDNDLPLWQRWRGEIHTKRGDSAAAVEAFRRYSVMIDKHLSARRGRQLGPGGESGGGADEGFRLVPDYIFDTFIVGDRNGFAFATAKAVAENPAHAYNPLFLYSDVGLGKTHLVNAIGNHIRRHHPKLRVLYTSVEEFVSELNDAIQANRINHFRNSHRRVDVLLIDDVQFLAAKERAQEEFFHLFNTLFQAHKQIVVTSDRPPREMTYLEKRLRSRFGAGVIVDIQPPTLETRLAIARRLVDEREADVLSEEVLTTVAERCTSNVRELKGALTQLLALAATREEPLTKRDATEVLDRLLESVS